VPEPDVVQLGDLTITLVPLSELEALRRSIADEITATRAKATKLGRQAGDRLAEAGQLLLERRSEWSAAPGESAIVASATQLAERIKQEQAEADALGSKPHSGLGGFFSRVGDSHARNRLQSEAAHDSEELRSQLVEIAQTAPSTSLSDAEQLREEAKSLQKQAADFTSSADQRSALLAAREAEIKRRQEAAKQLGFDSLYTAAMLQAHGPTSVESPLILKRGEQAYLTVSASLARRKTKVSFQGGSQGISFPIGHTGIRYRVGTFRGHPVSQDYIANIDSGTLVLSNQRVAFIGRQKSLAIPLDKILHVESYTDSLAIFKEGRENADFFLFAKPQEFLMYLNFLVSPHA